MAEIEFSVLARACLRGRNGDEGSLERAVGACVSERNAIGATINWRFTAKDARAKLRRLYPDVFVQRLGQVKWKENLSVLPFGGRLGRTPGTMVAGSVGGLCEGRGILPYRVARNTQLSSDLA